MLPPEQIPAKGKGAVAASNVEVDDAEDAEQGVCRDEMEVIVPKAGRVKAHASIQGCYPALKFCNI